MRIPSKLATNLLVNAQYFHRYFGMPGDLESLLEGFVLQATVDHPHTRFCENPNCNAVIDPTFILRDTCANADQPLEELREITTEPVTRCPKCSGSALRSRSAAPMINTGEVS
jgi:hypothetical protein